LAALGGPGPVEMVARGGAPGTSGVFLGWREWASLVPAAPANFKETPLTSAIWSDEAALERTDGFNLAGWRAELDTDLRRQRQRRTASSKTSEPIGPLSLPVIPGSVGNSVVAAALVASMAARGRVAASPTESPCISPEPASTRLRAAYGAEVPGKAAAPLVRLPRLDRRLEVSEAACISDPQMCREGLAEALQERQCHLEGLAQERRRRIQEAGQRQRRLVARRRRQKAAPKYTGEQAQSQTGSVVGEYQQDDREAQRALRAQQAIERITHKHFERGRTMTLSAFEQADESKLNTDDEALDCKRCSCREVSPRTGTGDDTAPTSEEEVGVSSDEVVDTPSLKPPRAAQQTLPGLVNTIVASKRNVRQIDRAKMRQVVSDYVLEQMKLKRMTKLRTMHRARFRNLPLAEQTAITNAFKLYVEEDGKDGGEGEDGTGTVLLGNIWRCVYELGMRGDNAQERHIVDLDIRQLGEVLLSGKGVHSSGSGESSQAEAWENVKVSLEDFGVGLVPLIRQDLSNERLDRHIQEFLSALPDEKALSLTAPEFVLLTQRLNLDEKYVAAAVAALPGRPTMPAHAHPHAAGHGASLDHHRKSKTSVVKHAATEPCLVGEVDYSLSVRVLDFGLVHKTLSKLEEQTGRLRRALEREILQKTRLPEEMFWKSRHEVLRLHNIFHVFDSDHSGYLCHEEVKRLLKRLGLQPYSKWWAPIVDKFLQECDQDDNQEVDFREFLLLMDMVREHQRRSRRNELWQEFLKFDWNRSGQLEPKELLGSLTSAGVVSSMHTRQLAQDMIEEFDTDKSGGMCFEEFEEFSQQIVERIFSEQNDRMVQVATNLGIDMEAMAECQWLFDELDTEGNESLKLNDIAKALQVFMIRAPSPEELHSIWACIDLDGNGQVEFTEFLHLMKIVTTGRASGTGMFSREKPFTLTSISVERQRMILRMFPIADSYIRDLQPGELLETLSNFLGVSKNANLREMARPAGPIRNARQLAEYARSLVGPSRAAGTALTGAARAVGTSNHL